MADKDKKWMQKAFSKNKGSLHRMLGIPEDEKIPWDRMVRAAHSKNSLMRKRAQAAMNAMRVNR